MTFRIKKPIPYKDGTNRRGRKSVFSYYGSKSKIVSKYPSPHYDRIIEPFAGSARYALRYSDREVWLNDSFEIVADIWRYLIRASESDIRSLPTLHRGDDLRKIQSLADVERNLLGFAVNMGVPYPANIYSTWAARSGEVERLKKRILTILPAIRHWKVTSLDFRKLPNVLATWYIDPPYQDGGHRYFKNKMDYVVLAQWCKDRNGHTMVCENNGADWLPFEPLTMMHGQRKKSIEVLWSQDTEDNEQ